jgi:osmotically inducible lipoprotein OsmB
MKTRSIRIALISVGAFAMTAGCATSDPTLRGAGRGAAIGAAGGAVLGAVTGGDVLTGAAIGAAGGAAVGAIASDGNNRCERDRRDRRVCYDRDGRRYYPR